MITVTVNLRDGNEHETTVNTGMLVANIDFNEVVDKIATDFPDWSSMVIVIVQDA